MTAVEFGLFFFSPLCSLGGSRGQDLMWHISSISSHRCRVAVAGSNQSWSFYAMSMTVCHPVDGSLLGGGVPERANSTGG